MNQANALSSRINERYNTGMYSQFAEQYYGGSGFYNYGYWKPGTRNQRGASEALVDRLIGMLPHTSGTILDVACGTGASTKRLLMHYPPSAVTGINISDKQLATARDRAPGCRFINMNAANLRFPPNAFDAVICVEAAFHFDTREKFLREAFRVLKPGGCLVLSDILLKPNAIAWINERVPAANLIQEVGEYERAYRRCGFEDVRVIDARARCWEPHRDSLLRFAWAKTARGEASLARLRRFAAAMRATDRAIGPYLVVSARKPGRRR
jgi:MPBQ/MSBQ methyltransferase